MLARIGGVRARIGGVVVPDRRTECAKSAYRVVRTLTPRGETATRFYHIRTARWGTAMAMSRAETAEDEVRTQREWTCTAVVESVTVLVEFVTVVVASVTIMGDSTTRFAEMRTVKVDVV